MDWTIILTAFFSAAGGVTMMFFRTRADIIRALTERAFLLRGRPPSVERDRTIIYLDRDPDDRKPKGP